MIRRRRLLGGLAGASTLAALSGCAAPGTGSARPRVAVVGGGYGGATAAKYLRLLSNGSIDVTLIEPEPAFVSCPMSNLVVAGVLELPAITSSYRRLSEEHGVTVVKDHATGIDVPGRSVTLAAGASLRYDKLVLSPGVELMFDAVAGSREAQASGRVLQAWKAGPETVALRRQLQAMADGGTFAITIPEAPFRCPAAPYERACLVADYFRRSKPRSKVLVLDANEDLVATGPLFRKAWTELYGSMIEYRNLHSAVAVDAASGTISFELQDDVRADVLNVLPPMRAGALAVRAGLANSNGRWCQVDFRSFESIVAKNVHVLGDSIQTASLMPKSGHMANSHGKAAAAAIVAELKGTEPDPRPMLINTCYSFVSSDEAIHASSVHAYSAAEKTFVAVPGSGGWSAARSPAEAAIGMAWARNIWADMLE
jgi:NADPH-dependent 2,4-dienoyl-CoA reductase/sulfur reductase-like enzyme